MAEEPEVETEAEESEEENAPKKRRLAGKTLILFVALPALLLVAAGTALYMFDPFELFGDSMTQSTENAPPKPVLFFQMPEMLVNLNHKDKRSQYLKLKVALEVSDLGTKRSIEPMMPRIMDIFQIYLRELRSEDLEGSAGVYRLKEELLRRINLVMHPRKVDRILFKEMIVQ